MYKEGSIYRAIGTRVKRKKNHVIMYKYYPNKHAI